MFTDIKFIFIFKSIEPNSVSTLQNRSMLKWIYFKLSVYLQTKIGYAPSVIVGRVVFKKIFQARMGPLTTEYTIIGNRVIFYSCSVAS